MSVRRRSRLGRAHGVLPVLALMGLCAAARAETLEFVGYAGVLGEW